MNGMVDSTNEDDSSSTLPVSFLAPHSHSEIQGNSNCESTFTTAENDTQPLFAVRDSNSKKSFKCNKFTPKLYIRRWIVLASYCLLTISNLSSWFAFSSISNIIQKYYHINLVQVNWLAMSFSTVSIVLLIPSYHLLERIGLGKILVMAGFFNAFGCCIRYIGYSKPSMGYWFLLVGSIFCAVSTSAFLFLPSKIAAVWFGEKERAKATSIAISADSLGMALSYFLPTSMVRNRPLVEEIGSDIGIFLLASTIEAVVIFLFICFSIKDKPPTPPSYSESRKASSNMDIQSCVGKSGYKALVKNIHFHTILNIHGVLFGIESVFLVALNEMLIGDFPGYEREIGVMGSIGLLLSIPTSFLLGVLLDRTHAFKRITIATTFLCVLFTALLSLLFSINAPFYTLFITYLAIVSTFSTYYTTAFEHCAELTFPVSEAQSGVILLWIAQIYSLLLEQLASLVLFYIGHKALLFCVLGLYFVIFVLSFCVKDRGPRPSLSYGSSP